MSGQLGTIPYPQVVYDADGNQVFLGGTQTQPVPSNVWQDVPATQAQPAATPATSSSGWFVPDNSGAANYSPTTGRPYIDTSLPPLDWGSATQPTATPATTTGGVPMAEHDPNVMPVLPVDPNTQKPVAGATSKGDMSGTTTGQQPKPDDQQKPAEKKADDKKEPKTALQQAQEDLNRFGPMPAYHPMATQEAPAPAPWKDPAAVLTTARGSSASSSTMPAWMQQSMLMSQTGHSYTKDDHEATAQRYRDMLSA